ncbi:MAG: ribosome-binding factor A [Bdellovibrionales bacterium RIFOXYD1_FULL_53_11]|nr:MAG: ribosome-binding factor A [Bdellovibrionales bacterium RIFOXYD1_FULL_53_11]
MQETRRARLQSLILEKISAIVSRELKDPRVPLVTITGVELAQDGSHATVHVALFGGASRNADGNVVELTEKEAARRTEACIKGLTSAAGFIKRRLGEEIDNVRLLPNLTFKEDRGIENVMRVHELLKTIKGNGNGP